MGKRLAALMLMVFMAAYSDAALGDWSCDFGGGGEESLPWMISAGDGLLAVGYTSSTDGDLRMRTRTGKAGWMLRLDAQGETLWSLCTAHVGRCEMNCPYAHSDGTFSAMLWAEGEGSEWLRVSEKGKVTARIEAPTAQEACGHGGAESVVELPFDRQGTPLLALLVTHEDGTGCCAVMDENGMLTKGAHVFQIPREQAFDICREGMGRIALVGATPEGDAQIQWIAPGGQQTIAPLYVPVALGKLRIVLDVLPCADGSVIFSGQLYGGGSIVMRVSAAGETIFALDDCENYLVMAHTTSGFVGADDDELAFYDEDGGYLGSVAYAPSGWMSSIAALDDGAAFVEMSDKAVRKPVRVSAVSGYVPAQAEEYEAAVYARERSALTSACVRGEQIVLDVLDGFGGSARVTLAADGAFIGEETAADAAGAEGFSLPAGRMTWRETPRGAEVSLIAADGTLAFETATPIHTAADQLEWRCAAQTPEGEYLLGGRYLTEIIANTEEKQILRDMTRDGLMQEGVIARLSADGVLKSVVTVEHIGCIEAIAPGKTDADTLLLCARSGLTDGLLSNILTLSGEDVCVLEVFFAPQEAALLCTQKGVFAAGTNIKNGRATVVVQPIAKFE